ncbi:hypothetical protein L3X38_038406 [Prunus dulcis]|uniref:Retrotransposon Copia-like N-terminal domain-containing protein n=1 Tax=Prunus dulcis TaxID=3755 RepID=A0AAD4YS54_PRUDU|nr:hypothetical protein L3X38_038406 [Prunus dulcis]
MQRNSSEKKEGRLHLLQAILTRESQKWAPSHLLIRVEYGDVLLPRNDGSSTSTAQIVTIQSDNSSLFVGLTLTETNYALWSQVMEMRIAAREKLGYLIGDTPKPLELSSTYNK